MWLTSGKEVNPQELLLNETDGLSGQYAILSLCWDPPTRGGRLLTTKVNLNDSLKCIPFDTLSKTFQDAIALTRAIGIQYLWMDTLYIVQDDVNDWIGEVAKMGDYYERAHLTIAAAAASNPSEGCFIPRPTLPDPVELPHITEMVSMPETCLLEWPAIQQISLLTQGPSFLELG